MRLIGYCRISSRSQEGNTSINSQAERIEEYCRFNGYELAVIFTGVESGAGLDRESFWRALRLLVCDRCQTPFPKTKQDLKSAIDRDCECGGKSSFDGIIAYDLDRIGRNARDVLWLGYDFLEKRKKTLIVLNGVGKCDTVSAMGRLLFGQLAVYAQFYRDNLVEKSDHGRKKRADAGEYVTGRPPYGLRRIAPGKLAVDPHETETLNFMKLLDSQGMSPTHIASLLTANNKYKRDGKPFKDRDVYALLRGRNSQIRQWWNDGCSYNYVQSARGF